MNNLIKKIYYLYLIETEAVLLGMGTLLVLIILLYGIRKALNKVEE